MANNFHPKKPPSKYTPMIILLVFIFATTIICAKIASAEHPPDWIIRGIAAVETGSHWSAPGIIKKGLNGPDLGPWQISKMVAKEHGFSASKIVTDIKYAEQCTIKYLTYLFIKLNSWDEVAKAWRGGIKGRNRSYAIEYGERVKNYGEFYAE